jgi:hypothetical protein
MMAGGFIRMTRSWQMVLVLIAAINTTVARESLAHKLPVRLAQHPVWLRLLSEFRVSEPTQESGTKGTKTKQCREGPLPPIEFELSGLPNGLRGQFTLEGGPSGRWCVEGTESTWGSRFASPCLTFRIRVVDGDRLVWFQDRQTSGLAFTPLGVRLSDPQIELPVRVAIPPSDEIVDALDVAEWNPFLIPTQMAVAKTCDKAAGAALYEIRDLLPGFAKDKPWGDFLSGSLYFNAEATANALAFNAFFERPPSVGPIPLALSSPFRGEVSIRHVSAKGPVCGRIDRDEDEKKWETTSVAMDGLVMTIRVWRKKRLILEKTVAVPSIKLYPFGAITDAYDDTRAAAANVLTANPPGRSDAGPTDDEYRRFVVEMTTGDATCGSH